MERAHSLALAAICAHCALHALHAQEGYSFFSIATHRSWYAISIWPRDYNPRQHEQTDYAKSNGSKSLPSARYQRHVAARFMPRVSHTAQQYNPDDGGQNQENHQDPDHTSDIGGALYRSWHLTGHIPAGSATTVEHAVYEPQQ